MNYTGEKYEINGQTVEIFKVDHDVNGNPRYVIHFLALLESDEPGDVFEKLAKATGIIRDKLGGKKYRASWFGGGLVFQSYNVREDLALIIPAA